MKIVAESDVFLTNFLPGVRGQLNIEVEDIRKYNADIIYARGVRWVPPVLTGIEGATTTRLSGREQVSLVRCTLRN